jgi:hypothetical protein
MAKIPLVNEGLIGKYGKIIYKCLGSIGKYGKSFGNHRKWWWILVDCPLPCLITRG